MLETGFPCLLALQVFAAKVICSPVLNEGASGFDEGERRICRHTFSMQLAHPLVMAGACSRVVFSACDDLLDSIGLSQATGRGFLDRHASDKRRTHDAAVCGRRGEQEGNPLICPALVFTGYVKHDVMPAIAPVAGQTVAKTLGAFGQNEELYVGPLADDIPYFWSPGIGLGQQEVARHADTDKLAGANFVAAVSAALEGIGKARLAFANHGGVDTALSVHVIHVAVVASLADARAAMPGVPDVVHLCASFAADVNPMDPERLTPDDA